MTSTTDSAFSRSRETKGPLHLLRPSHRRRQQVRRRRRRRKMMMVMMMMRKRRRKKACLRVTA